MAIGYKGGRGRWRHDSGGDLVGSGGEVARESYRPAGAAHPVGSGGSKKRPELKVSGVRQCDNRWAGDAMVGAASQGGGRRGEGQRKKRRGGDMKAYATGHLPVTSAIGNIGGCWESPV